MESKLVTLRVDPQLWADFRAACDADGVSASAALRAFMTVRVAEALGPVESRSPRAVAGRLAARLAARLSGESTHHVAAEQTPAVPSPRPGLTCPTCGGRRSNKFGRLVCPKCG